MISKEEMLKLGNDFIPLALKTEVTEYDKFMPEHVVEFKLSIMGIAYIAKVKPEADNLDKQHVHNIWSELFSSFFSDFNRGLSKSK